MARGGAWPQGPGSGEPLQRQTQTSGVTCEALAMVLVPSGAGRCLLGQNNVFRFGFGVAANGGIGRATAGQAAYSEAICIGRGCADVRVRVRMRVSAALAQSIGPVAASCWLTDWMVRVAMDDEGRVLVASTQARGWGHIPQGDCRGTLASGT